jgi:hypothetical protein
LAASDLGLTGSSDFGLSNIDDLLMDVVTQRGRRGRRFKGPGGGNNRGPSAPLQSGALGNAIG